MSRPIRSSAVALIVAGGMFLVPVTPARAGLGFRDLGGIPREVREQGLLGAFTHLLERIFEGSGGGMDPNGDH